jgi:methyltransferase (TIGR00027 family)
MRNTQSRTALAAAAHRAAHQVLERGSIFSDPLAVRILGAEAEEAIRGSSGNASTRKLRLFIAVRSRIAEDALAVALHHGVRQVVVLGAGLDTYAYRSTGIADLRIFEVDHPATQAWKRKCLADAGITLPPALILAPLDFERATLGATLELAGLDPNRRTFFTWLGVVPYLTEPWILKTLRYIADLSAGAEVVFDYCNPLSAAATAQRAADRAALAARVASVGEPFQSYFDTAQLLATLAGLGFTRRYDWGPAEIRARFFSIDRGSSGNEGGHVVSAAT